MSGRGTRSWETYRLPALLIRLPRPRKPRALTPRGAGLLRTAAYAGVGARSVDEDRGVGALRARLGVGLEDLVDRAALVGPLDQAQAGRDAERRRRLALEDLLGHRLVDRRGVAAAGLQVAVAERARLVEADEDADGDVGRRT